MIMPRNMLHEQVMYTAAVALVDCRQPTASRQLARSNPCCTAVQQHHRNSYAQGRRYEGGSNDACTETGISSVSSNKAFQARLSGQQATTAAGTMPYTPGTKAAAVQALAACSTTNPAQSRVMDSVLLDCCTGNRLAQAG